MRDYRRALDDVSEARRLAPANSFHHQFHGVLAYGLDRSRASLRSLTKAIELLPSCAPHLIWRAAVHVDLQHSGRALADLDSAIATGDFAAYFWRSLLHVREGHYVKAKYDLRNAAKDGNGCGSARVLFWQGVVGDLAGKTSAAHKRWARAMDLAEAEAKLGRHTERARVSLLRGEAGKAVRALYEPVLSVRCDARDCCASRPRGLTRWTLSRRSNTTFSSLPTSTPRELTYAQCMIGLRSGAHISCNTRENYYSYRYPGLVGKRTEAV